MHQRAPRARRQAHVDQPALQAQDLPQPLDVAPRQRQQPSEIRGSLRHRRRSTGGGIRLRVLWPSGTSSDPSRIGVGQRVGDVLEPRAVGVERGERLPQTVVAPRLQLLRDRLEQPSLGEHPERALRPTPDRSSL